MALIDKLSAIGDAIREKNGTTDLMTLEQMPQAIADIQSGGGTDTRMKELIEGTLTELYDEDATKVGGKALFYYSQPFSVITLPNATSVGEDAFRSCIATNINLPKLETISENGFRYAGRLLSFTGENVVNVGRYAFGNCISLESVSFPKLTKLPDYMFYSCTNLKSVHLPLFNDDSVYYPFSSCPSLTEIKLPSAKRACEDMFTSSMKTIILPVCKIMDSAALRGCCSLTTLVLGGNSLVGLTSASYLTKLYHMNGTVDATYNPDGLRDGYIYVPRALLSDEDETMDYRRATNWTTLADRFRAIEDYTVDGTADGELDWDKINRGVTV